MKLNRWHETEHLACSMKGVLGRRTRSVYFGSSTKLHSKEIVEYSTTKQWEHVVPHSNGKACWVIIITASTFPSTLNFDKLLRNFKSQKIIFDLQLAIWSCQFLNKLSGGGKRVSEVWKILDTGKKGILFPCSNTSTYCKYGKVKIVTQNAAFVMSFKNNNATTEIIDSESFCESSTTFWKTTCSLLCRCLEKFCVLQERVSFSDLDELICKQGI